MENLKHGRKTIRFWQVSGEVLGTNKFSETHVSISSSGGGGGGYVHPQYGGHVNVQAPQIHSTSTTIINHEFWLRTKSGEEKPIKLRGVDIPLREGQKVTVISAGLNKKKSGWYAVLVNHSAKKHWFIKNAVELNKTMRLEGPTGLSIFLAAFAFSATLWLQFEPWREPVRTWAGPFLLFPTQFTDWQYVRMPLIVAGLVFFARIIRKIFRVRRLISRLKSHLEGLAQQAYKLEK